MQAKLINAMLGVAGFDSRLEEPGYYLDSNFTSHTESSNSSQWENLGMKRTSDKHKVDKYCCRDQRVKDISICPRLSSGLVKVYSLGVAYKLGEQESS